MKVSGFQRKPLWNSYFCKFSFAAVVLVLFTAPFLSHLLPLEATGKAEPSLHQNLVVRETILVESRRFRVAGNLTVASGGRLVLLNSTLEFEGTEPRHYLVVEPGGELVINRSRVTGPEGSYTIFVKHGSKFVVVNSIVENAGWKDHRDDGKYIWIGPAYTVDYSFYGHGLEVNTTVKEFRGNVLSNVASVRFYSSGNVVENNTVVGMRHEGMAFFGSDNIVRGNVFAGRVLNRETYGLKFYPGTMNQLVANNTFRDLCIGIFVSLVPPWTPGVNFTISGNRMRRVIQGLVAKLRNSRVSGEDYRDVWSTGIFVAASENVVVENSRVENLTLYDESVAGEDYFQEAKPYIHPKYPRAYYNFFLLLRGGIMVSWSGRNITLRNNLIAYVPPYGYGIAFDVKYIVYDSKIVGNKFLHIGDLQPPWELSNPGLGSVPLDKLRFIPPGAAIELESTENLVIENNTFTSCLNGILTSFPDAIGNYGNLTIINNTLTGTYYAEWSEQGRRKLWPGIGIGVGTAAHRPEENKERWKVYSSKARIEIRSNRVENFTYALVVDVRNWTLKKVSVVNNTFRGYVEILAPDYVSLSGNSLVPVLPDLEVTSLAVDVSNNTVTVTVWVRLVSPVPLRKTVHVEIELNGEKRTEKLYLSEPKLYSLKHVAELPSGEYTVKVHVDALDELREKNEGNNYAQRTVKVGQTQRRTSPHEPSVKKTEPKELLNPYTLLLIVSAAIALVLIFYLLAKREESFHGSEDW